MKQFLIYTLYDATMKEGGVPFVANNNEHALRMFYQAIEKDPFPEDKQLWCLGEYTPELPEMRVDKQYQPTQITPNVKDIEDASK